VQPGQHDDVVAVALGYGSKLSERFADIGPPWLEAVPAVGANGMVGSNAAPMLTWNEGTLRRQRLGVRVSKTEHHHSLAISQMYPSMKVPAEMAPPVHQKGSIVKEMTLTELLRQERSPKRESARKEEDLWPVDHPVTGHRWGMVIDLNAC